MPPPEMSWASVQRLGVLPDEADELGALAAQQEDTVAARPAGRDRRHVAHEADAADHGRRRDRAAAGLVVERHVSRDDRNPQLVRGLGDPVDRLRQLPADLGLLGVAEVQAVGERERLAARAGDVERRAKTAL